MFLRDSRLIPRHQQLFLIEGVATIGLAIIFAFILPNSPKTVRGHTEQEREWLAWTFGQDQGQQDHSDEITAWRGFKMATADPKTWLLMGTLYCVSITLRSLSTATPLLTSAVLDLYCGCGHELLPICCCHTWLLQNQDIWSHCC
jgi:hypothetical protein